MYKFGNQQAWIKNRRSYETLKEAWLKGDSPNPDFLYVYEDNDLITVIDLRAKVKVIQQELPTYKYNRFQNLWEGITLQAATELLVERMYKDEGIR